VTSGVSYIDSLPWTPFAAMKAQQQITAAKKLTPTIHDTKGILGYESIQTVRPGGWRALFQTVLAF